MNTSNKQSRRRALLPAGACALAFAFGLTGCSTPKIHTEHDRAIDFSRYKTFAVLPLTATGAGVDPGTVLRLAQPAEQAVRDALIAKGLTEAAREKADAAVLVRGESLPRVEVTDWGYTSYPVGVRRRGWVYYGGYHDVDVRTSENRRLIVEIYDSASHKQAWVGWLERSGGGPVEPENVRQGIQKILEGFPPTANAP